ncbi:hypothetical protein DL93DRAFT_2077653 [Clavulina sp. PMI_390]|nr:hypothetical protein DL93DRAFT_2077653 [Clavulina sp. PMI_390]
MVLTSENTYRWVADSIQVTLVLSIDVHSLENSVGTSGRDGSDKHERRKNHGGGWEGLFSWTERGVETERFYPVGKAFSEKQPGTINGFSSRGAVFERQCVAVRLGVRDILSMLYRNLSSAPHRRPEGSLSSLQKVGLGDDFTLGEFFLNQMRIIWWPGFDEVAPASRGSPRRD